MKGFLTRSGWAAMLLTSIVAVLWIGPISIHGADTDLPVYLEDSTMVLKTQTINRIQYLPLSDIVRQMALPYTNDSTQEIFTIRGKNAQLVMTRNSAAISINNQITLLNSPVLHDNGVWLVPVDFLSTGLSRITGTDFRRHSGTPRIFAGAVKPSELAMNAQSQGTLTRLTLRNSIPVNLELRKDSAQHRVLLVFGTKPIDPAKESVDYKDRLVQSINFNDSDGTPKIVVETSDEVVDIRISSTDENRVHFIDFIRKAEVSESAPAAPAGQLALANAGAGAAAVAQQATPAPHAGGVHVIVIDPGHGGTESGATTAGALEKDLTLAVARKLRTTLQTRLGSTVLLTRDSDVPLSSEARASVANNNQADLFLSIHIGYSADKADMGSSVYVIQENFAESLAPPTKGARLFLPWYLGYRTHRAASVQIAGLMSEELSQAIPGWSFPVRSGPVGVLASTTMPSVLLEIGNINNPLSIQALLDSTFQTKLTTTVSTAIERFVAAGQGAK